MSLDDEGVNERRRKISRMSTRSGPFARLPGSSNNTGLCAGLGMNLGAGCRAMTTSSFTTWRTLMQERNK